MFVTLAPQSWRPHLADAQVERFGAYFVVGLAFALAYPKRLRLVALGVVAGAVCLELLQLIAPGRDAGVRDALAKSLGGLSAVLAVGTVRATSRRKGGAD
jgi:VanZ family protein